MAKPRKPKPEALNNTPNAIFREWKDDGTYVDWPYRRRELPQQMQELPLHLAVHGWLQRVSLETVVILWQQAQAIRKEKEERNASTAT